MATKVFGEQGKKRISGDKPSENVSKDNAEFRGYINVNLSDDQKAEYVHWAASSSYWEALEYQLSAGVNLSVKRSLKEGCYIASGTQRDERSPNAGLCVTARGKQGDVALGRLLFTLTILTKHERWEETQSVANPDRW